MRRRPILRTHSWRRKELEPIGRHFNLPNHYQQHIAICGLCLLLEYKVGCKTLEQNFKCLSNRLPLSPFYSTHLFLSFSRCHVPTNNVTPFFLSTHTQTMHNSSISSARNVIFRNSLQWSIYIINSVNKTKVSM